MECSVELNDFDPNATTFLCNPNCSDSDFISAIRFWKKTDVMSNKFYFRNIFYQK